MPDFNGLEPINTSVDNSIKLVANPVGYGAPSIPDVASSKKPSLNDSVQNDIDAFANKRTPDDGSKFITSAELNANKKYSTYNPTISDQETAHAEGQTTSDRIANASVNFAVKIGAFLGQSIGGIGGALGAATLGTVNLINENMGDGQKVFDNPISLMTDNWLYNASSALHDKVGEEFPIYKGEQYTKGSIWQKLGTSSWWLDDAVDRAALGVATMLPFFGEAALGARLGLSPALFGAIEGEGGVVQATGLFSKGIKALENTPELYSTIGKEVGKDIFKATAKATELEATGLETGAQISQTTELAEVAKSTIPQPYNFDSFIKGMSKLEKLSWGTIGQSSLCAREAQMGIRKKLNEQIEAGLIPKDTDVEGIAADAAKEAFWVTAPLSLIESAVELPQIFSTMKFSKSIASKLGGLLTASSEEAIDTAFVEGAKATVRPSIGKVAAKMLFTGLEHGPFSENLQVAISRYLEDSVAGKVDKNDKPLLDANGKVIKDESGWVNGVAKNWFDNFVSDPNGQNNVALGFIQGAFNTLFGFGKGMVTGEYAKQDKTDKAYIDSLRMANFQRRFFATPTDFYEKEADGSIKLDANKKPVKDQKIVAAMGVALFDQTILKVQERNQAIEDGDITKLQQLNFNALKNSAYEFLSDRNGMEYFSHILAVQKNEQRLDVNRKNDFENGVEITPEVQYQRNMEHLKALKESFEHIETRSNSQSVLNVGNSPIEQKIANTFTNEVKSAQYILAGDQIFFNDKINRNNIELSRLENKGDRLSTDDDRITEIKSENEMLSKKLQDAKDQYGIIASKENFINSFPAYKEDYLQTIKTAAESKQRAEENTKKITPTGESITVKTSRGETELKKGETYVAGGSSFETEDGVTIPKFSEFEVLGKNEDGNIVIRTTNDNLQRVMKPEAFEKYVLGKSSALSKSDRFFIDNSNKKFTYQFGKSKTKKIVNGQVVEGPKSSEGVITRDSKNGLLYFESIEKNKNGTPLYRIPVSLDQFSPKEGFTQAQIYSKEIFSDKTKALLQEKDTAKDQQNKQAIQNQLANKAKVLSDLYQKSKDRLEEVNKSLKEKREKYEKILKQYKKANEKFANGQFKSETAFKGAFTRANNLASLKTEIQKEIENLENEQTELEGHLPYFEGLLENIQELPETTKEIIEELKDDIANLSFLVAHNEQKVDDWNSLLNRINNALKTATDVLSRTIDKIRKEVPDMPIQFDALKERIEKYYGEYGVNDQLTSGTNETLEQYKEMLEMYNEYIDAQDIPGKEKDVESKQKDVQILEEEIKAVVDELKKLQEQQQVKTKILEAFEKYEEAEREKAAQEEKLRKDKELINFFIGTQNQDSEITFSDNAYEPDYKKDNLTVVSSTIGPATPNAPYGKRAISFANKLANLPTTDSRRNTTSGFVISAANEEQLIPGVTKHIAEQSTDTTVDATKLVVLVVTNENGQLIDQDFNVIDKDDENLLDKAIYQTFPKDSLEWANGKSLFRNSDKSLSDEQQQYKEQYAVWRANQLKATDISQTPTPIGASFGIPEYEEIQKDNNGKTIVKGNSVSKTGLLSSLGSSTQVFSEQPLLTVAKEPTVTKNNTSFTNALGRVFLSLPGGLVKVLNRQLNEKQASAIYEALYKIAKNKFEAKEETKQETEKLIRWLRTIVNWGTPKNKAGYNSVYFDKDAEGNLNLFISGKQNTPICAFTPSSLENIETKNQIITLLQNLYHNVNSKAADGTESVTTTYTEFYIDKEGKFVSREWINYQSYLLSDRFIPSSKTKNVSTSEREGNTPLYTNIKKVPTDVEGATDRKGNYFFLKDAEDNFSYVPKPTVQKIIAGAPIAQKAKETTEQTSTFPKIGNFVADGTTIHEYETPRGNVDFNLKIENGFPIVDLNTALGGGVSKKTQEAINKVKEAKGFDDKEASIQLALFIGQQLKAQLEKENSEKQQAAPEQKIDISDIDYDGLPSEDTLDGIDKGSSVIDSEYRIQLENNNFEKENWTKAEEWLKKNFPNLPVYRVKNLIQATNGKLAWGMLHNAAIYVYENAEVGTVYHEVFEGVWKMFAPKSEQESVTNEFRNRKGTFFDKFQQKDIKYSEATDSELKEQLAEEFRDYVQFGQIPPKAEGKNWIANLFRDIVNTIKSFFLGPQAKSKTEQLFKNINEAKYAEYGKEMSQLSLANKGVIDIKDAIGDNYSDFREIAHVTPADINAIMEQMTFTIISNLTKEGGDLFNEANLKGSEVYDSIQKNLYNPEKDFLKETKQHSIIGKKLIETRKLFTSGNITKEEYQKRREIISNHVKYIQNNWDTIRERHQEYLSKFGIQFDENDSIILNDENKSGKEDYQDATKIDSYRKASAAIKLLTGTLPIMENTKGGDPTPSLSSIGGVKLVPSSEAFMAIMNNVANTTGVDDMLKKLKEFAKDNINYRRLYKRLTDQDANNSDDVSISATNPNGIKLITSFFRTFAKQSPDTKIVFILDNGDVQVGDANFTKAAAQIKNDFENGLRKALLTNNKYFTKDTKNKVYTGNKGSVEEIRKDVAKNPKNINSIYIKFLNELGIIFNESDIKNLQAKSPKEYKTFIEATEGVLKSINEAQAIATLNAKTLDVNLRFSQLSEIKAKIENPEFDSVFYNVNGEKTQTFIGTNVISDLFNILSKVDNLNQLRDTRYKYLLDDAFCQNSVVLGKMFSLTSYDGNPPSYNKLPNTSKENYLKPGYVDGTITPSKSKSSSKLSYSERLVQELNLNLQGWYLNLVPGDAAMEHMLNVGNTINVNDTTEDVLKNIYDVFKGYLIDEINVSQDNRKIVEPKGADRKSTDLRFFKSILGKELHNKIVDEANKPTFDFEKTYKKYENEINKSIKEYVEKDAEETIEKLEEYGIYDGKSLQNISLAKEITKTELKNKFLAITGNYMIANIEMHKLIYSDPYLYKDELKRIKNFNSPAQPIIANSKQMNQAFNKVWNKRFARGERGFVDFERETFNTAVNSDVESVIIGMPNYEEKSFTETDGQGIISLSGYKQMRVRSSDWTEADEAQYQYDVKYENIVKSGDSKEEIERKLNILRKDNPQVQSTYTPIKPITRGNKANEANYNDVILDKFALYPLSYRVMHELNPNSNALKLYDKMQKENIDYMVFESGRKVGAENIIPLYNSDGTFNETPYTPTKVYFSTISIQSEVPTKDTPKVTMGSQVTKLVTMDFMEAGVPIDFLKEENNISNKYVKWNSLSEEQKEKTSPLYKEIKNNQRLLEAIQNNGVQTILNKLGIKEIEKGKYIIEDKAKTKEELKRQVLSQEININISEALKDYENGTTILEATPIFQQIRNILYSIADKEVFSPKINGGMKVQITSALLESNKVKEVKLANGKKAFTNDTLKFYRDKDGERYCEIMLGRWFDSDMSDKELLEYLNTTKEGQSILSGIGFRIPTQKQNSIDRFVIKQFLPKEFGDSVVVPSALVNKVGSDFDIDKLSVYLRNIYETSNKKIAAIPFFGVGENAKQEIKRWLTKNEINTDFFKAKPKEGLEELDIDQALEDDLNEVDKVYKMSLQNEYLKSMENLVSHEENYKNLVKPNSADELKDLSDKVVKATQGDGKQIDYSSVGNMLSRTFMSSLRHAFVTGKYAISIAATAQTNHSINQKQLTFINRNKIKNLPDDTAKWLGDGEIYLPHNKIVLNGESNSSLSGINDAKGNSISDVIGQFIDGYVDIAKGPWIMELGATPKVAGTWLFLTKIGVPINQVAYFMNQPIVRDYLKAHDNSGYSWLFIGDLIDDVKSKYNSNKPANINEAMSSLEKTMGSTPSTSEEKANQLFILDEFLKYSMMANQLFLVQNGTNIDTATLNDPMLVFKKQEQLAQARNSIIDYAGGIDEMLKNSFLGNLFTKMNSIRNAFSEILPSDKGTARDIIESILAPYVNMPDRDFLKLSKKTITNLFDYMVQTADVTKDGKKAWNTLINTFLVNPDQLKKVADFIDKIKKDPTHPLYNNQIIKLASPQFQDREGWGTNGLKIKNSNNKVYDQNQMIYAFDELRNYGDMTIYKTMVGISILQSGLSTTNLSFTNLLPYDTFKDIYGEIISNINDFPNLENFLTNNVFQRNNWNDDDIVPTRKAKLTTSGKYNTNMNFGDNSAITQGIINGKIPQLLKLDNRSREANKDVIVYTWVDNTFTPKEKEQMAKAGDFSFIKKGLFQKVKESDGTPFENSYAMAGGINTNYIYKMINAWGNGVKANEFYDYGRPSVINNGFEKVQNETINDNEITKYFTSDTENKPIIKEKTTSKEKKQEHTPQFSNINPTDQFKTWDLGGYEGTPQTKEAQETIDKLLIDNPQNPVIMFNEKGRQVGQIGESFNHFADRILQKTKDIINKSPANSVILTHNTAFGLIKLWNSEGRPNELSKEFREKYTKQNAKTADVFEIEGKNGKVIIMRHGQTVDNVSSSPNFRKAESELTEQGIQEAQEVGKQLSNTKISNIYSSSLNRAIHTANLIMAEQKTSSIEKENKVWNEKDAPFEC